VVNSKLIAIIINIILSLTEKLNLRIRLNYTDVFILIYNFLLIPSPLNLKAPWILQSRRYNSDESESKSLIANAKFITKPVISDNTLSGKLQIDSDYYQYHIILKF
jgi:hypothetical protein